jgi:selenide,water dikinase
VDFITPIVDGLEVHALTDITGFGLLCHLIEMVEGSQLTDRHDAEAVPVLDEFWPLIGQGVYPGGATRNRECVEFKVAGDIAVSEDTRIVLTDPQSLGGLLFAVAPSDVDPLLNRLGGENVPTSAVIGEMSKRSDRLVEFTR